MELGSGSKPHMAIDTTTAVPPGVGLVAIVHPDSHHIVSTPVEIGSEVVFKRTVTVGPLSEKVPVEIHGCVHIYSIELDEILVLVSHSKMLPIPSYPSGQRPSARARRVGWQEVTLNGPVMWQVEVSPGIVVVFWSCHLHGVGKDEQPVVIEALALPCAACCSAEEKQCCEEPFVGCFSHLFL